MYNHLSFGVLDALYESHREDMCSTAFPTRDGPGKERSRRVRRFGVKVLVRCGRRRGRAPALCFHYHTLAQHPGVPMSSEGFRTDRPRRLGCPDGGCSCSWLCISRPVIEVPPMGVCPYLHSTGLEPRWGRNGTVGDSAIECKPRKAKAF